MYSRFETLCEACSRRGKYAKICSSIFGPGPHINTNQRRSLNMNALLTSPLSRLCFPKYYTYILTLGYFAGAYAGFWKGGYNPGSGVSPSGCQWGQWRSAPCRVEGQSPRRKILKTKLPESHTTCEMRLKESYLCVSKKTFVLIYSTWLTFLGGGGSTELPRPPAYAYATRV